ncbi:MAG: glycoside hydrolase family 20 zincin-like fold domain-containing protein [Flavitalea sp.]
MKDWLTIFFLVLIFNASSQVKDIENFKKYFRILPEPQKIELSQGKPFSVQGLKFVHLEGVNKFPISGSLFNDWPVAGSRKSGTLTLSLSVSKTLPASPEAYVLEVKSDQVIITAREERGLFYGCQTLLQMLEDANDQQVDIPLCKITDYPGLAYRSFHIDMKHHLDSLSYYYKLIDRLASLKINAIIIEFEDKLQYREASVIGSSQAMPVETFASLSRYAASRYIEVSPLVQGLGHSSFILKHDEYKDLRDNPAVDESFDPLNPKTYELVFSMYKDAMQATPGGKYLHVGGDEVASLGFSEKAKKTGKNAFQLQLYWLQKVCDFAHQHGRIPIFWDDMVFELAQLSQTTYDSRLSEDSVNGIWKRNEHLLNEQILSFPKNCIYMRWNYDDPAIPGNVKALKWYSAHQLQVMAATAAQTKWPMLPRRNSNFQAIKDFSRISAEQKLDGILLTMWDDSSPHFETCWRGIYDFAFFSWHYKDVNRDDLHSLFRHRFYGPSLEENYFNFEDSLEISLDFWESALLNKGRRNNYPASIDMISLPEDPEPVVWREKYMAKIEQARKEVSSYKRINEKIEKAQGAALRNQYSLRIFKQINELQVYSSKVLLLLNGIDMAGDISSRNLAKQELRQYVNDFSSLRKQFEKVFAETRILNKPCDLLPDQGPHLANGTINTDWMYVYELALNRKINYWLSD